MFRLLIFIPSKSDTLGADFMSRCLWRLPSKRLRMKSRRLFPALSIKENCIKTNCFFILTSFSRTFNYSFQSQKTFHGFCTENTRSRGTQHSDISSTAIVAIFSSTYATTSTFGASAVALATTTFPKIDAESVEL